ncbi:hypothetical protein GOV11_01380 [Candidatus Woesearchaeota archaeon]|nr:hypothetical protein [Candidatus Woesearchaeota archaeon]
MSFNLRENRDLRMGIWYASFSGLFWLAANLLLPIWRESGADETILLVVQNISIAVLFITVLFGVLNLMRGFREGLVG